MSQIKFVEIAVAKSGNTVGKPAAAVRQDGQVVFNAASNKLFQFPAIPAKPATETEPATEAIDRQYYKIGSDGSGKIYLLPAKADDANVLKATKNNDGMQFRQNDAFAPVGAKVGDKFTVSEIVESGVTIFVLTPYTKAEKAAEAKTEEKAPEANKPTDAEIAAKVEASKPNAKDAAKAADAAAKKAAKADFKKDK